MFCCRSKRFGRISSHFSRVSLVLLTIEFLILYVLIGTIFAFAYWITCKYFPEINFSFNKGGLCLAQSFYFSFITQLTVGYGDFAPLGYARPLAIIQGIFGVLFAGIWAGVVLAKWFTAGSRESIRLADWAGYSLREERFFVLFVNCRVDDLVDVNINAIVKLEGYNPVPPGVNAPYIGRSAWPFFLQTVTVDEMAQLKLFPEGDGIKISISGTSGMTRCTNYKKYKLENLWVLPNLDYYSDSKFDDPLLDRKFFEEFKRPQNQEATPFLEFKFDEEAQRRKNGKKTKTSEASPYDVGQPTPPPQPRR